MNDELLVLGPDREGRSLSVGPERIESVDSAAADDSSRVQRVECPEAELALPFVNAHTHLYSGLVPLGMPAPKPAPGNFLEILERVWWKLDRQLDADILRASARYYVAHALLAGTSALIDHHESPQFIDGSLEVLADACQELGMRALLCYGATERNGGASEGTQGLEECARFLRANRRPLVRGMVGLHASFTVSDEICRAAGDLARELDTVVHVHVAEDGADVEDAQRRGYPGPLERLLALEALVPRSILAHGVHLTENQVRAAEQAGCWLVQNPRSNRGNGVGYPLGFGTCSRIALGTDGYPSNGEDEIAALLEQARKAGQSTSIALLRPQRGHGILAERFGCPRSGLVQGALPDAMTRGRDGLRDLVVGGRLVVSEGRLQTGDIDEIDAEAERAAAQLWQRMGVL